MVSAASARPMQLMICWHQTAEVWPHVSEKRLDQRRLSVCLMHEMRNDVRCPDVSRNSVQTNLTRLYPFITFDVSWLYMIMIHDFTFAAGCLCVAAFLMSRDESSRIDRSRSMAGPTGGSAWTGASRPIGPWFCQGPHTGCQLCRASGSWCLCQWRAVWLIPGNCSQMQLAIQFEFDAIILVQFDRFQNFRLLWLCTCDRCKTKHWKIQSCVRLWLASF